MKTARHPRPGSLIVTLCAAACFATAQDDPFGLTSLQAPGASPEDVLLADLDGDGHLDLASANRLANSVRVMSGDGVGGFGAHVSYPVGSQPVSIGVADLDADGRLDLFTADAGVGRVSILFGEPGGFAAAQSHDVGFAASEVVAADLDGDGHLDLAAAADDVFQPLTLLLGDGARGFSVAPLPQLGWNAGTLAAGDLDGDDLPELVVGSLIDDSLLVVRGTNAYQSGPLDAYPVGPDPRGVTLVDIDGDGLLDALSADSGAAQISLLRGLPGGQFAPAEVYAVGNGPVDLAVGDFDGDERLDVISADYLGSSATLLRGDGAGGFLEGVAVDAGVLPVALAAGDVDGDFHLDVVAANAFFSALQVLISNVGPWIDLGYAKAGLSGAPRLMGMGATVPGNQVQVSVTSAGRVTGGAGVLVVGFGRLDAPFHGGQLVPLPQALVPIAPNGSLAFRWPHGLLPGTNVYWQAWFPQQGVQASNALRTVHDSH